MGRPRLIYFMEHRILRTRLENSKSKVTAFQLVQALAEGRDISDICCHRQEIPASQFSR